MDAILSLVRDIKSGLRSVIGLLSKANDDFNKAQERVSEPRLPDPSTTESFWQKNPLFPELVNIKSHPLPISADIVIIGSGIAGASVAYTILNECEAIGITKRVFLLEARELCSGATGRNGGHIKATPYHFYPHYRARFGPGQAKKLCEFQMRHLPALLEIARREELVGAEVREVETVDVYTDGDMWRKAEGMLKELRNDFPALAEGIEMHTATDAQEVCDSCRFDGNMLFADRFYRNMALASIASAPSATVREQCGRIGL
jgi:glycine/D-amino acid oxidase-like deaminating enzyme